jgi:TonB family protein
MRGTKVASIASITLTSLLLSSQAFAKRKPAASELPLAPPTVDVQQLIEQLSSLDEKTRVDAARQLAGVKDPTADLLSALRNAAEDEHRSVRYAARWALGHLARNDKGEPEQDYDSPAKILQSTRPDYPPKAFWKRIQGTVLLDVLIGEAGEVAHAEVRQSIPMLDDAAVACVRQWQFSPALRNGKPIATLAHAPIKFLRID